MVMGCAAAAPVTLGIGPVIDGVAELGRFAA